MASHHKHMFSFLCVLWCLQLSFASHDDLLHQHTHLVHLSSLFPSSTCTSLSQGAKRKGSLEVVHKHGPCSRLRLHQKSATQSEILSQDQRRVNSIHSKISKDNNGLDGELDSASLPAKSGSLIGAGNYFVTVGLGTPKRDLSLIFDTGSDLTWTQCQPCAGYCYKQQDPTFDPSKSTSYSNITCTSPLCTQLSSATGNQPQCSASTKACIYGIQYGDNSYSLGYFSKERLTISPDNVVDDFLFGCGQKNRGLFGRAAGLLGLGRHPVSFVQQTAQKYHKIFSYCLPSTASSAGYLNFGGGASTSLKYTQISRVSLGTSFYGVDIVGIIVAGTKLPISTAVFSTAGAIIDSGTVITRLPPGAYSPLRTAFRKAMSKYPAAEALSILDTCYDLSGYKSFSIPKISFLFNGGVNVDLAAAGILYAASEQQVCLAFAANEDETAVAIFGNVQQKTLEVFYDVGAAKLGFGVAGCK